ncbi:porin [Prochlorococcus marinus]|uniref:Possible porin n=1 Tax=Prochlorococcus marinus (strain AS9601) TaxID=146891 RepID=A2BRU8_PROMS|nr:porin [Prochlorococcus marinus]ABM70509.1 possible porin [Prochlorococcus marinus str. AS9601]
MKLFKSLLVAPATIGLLAPLSTFAGEADLNNISKYSDLEHIDLANAFVNDELNHDSLLAGGEGLVDDHSHDGSFSETTSASFSVDAVLGAIDGATSETTSLDYQFNIGLSTSFTGEDSLDITIDSGNSAASVLSKAMGFDEGTKLNVDGVTYTFPVGGATMIVGDATDISASFTGACLYSAFTDYTPDDCGTGNSLGVTGKAVTASISYAFDNGFSVAGGISSPEDEILGDSSDIYGLNAAYTTDTYGLAVGYSTDDGGTGAETTTWGFQGYYSFDLADLSVGYETQDDGSDDKTGYFVGLTFSDVGPGTVNVAAATTGLFKDTESEKMIYEASYSYPVNDGMTITPGVFIVEDTTDDTGVAVKASFSF